MSDTGDAQRLPAPWFDHDRQLIAGRRIPPRLWRMQEILWSERGRVVPETRLREPHYGPRTTAAYIAELHKWLERTPYQIDSRYGFGWGLVGPAPFRQRVRAHYPRGHAAPNSASLTAAAQALEAAVAEMLKAGFEKQAIIALVFELLASR